MHPSNSTYLFVSPVGPFTLPLGAGKGGTSYSLGTLCSCCLELPVPVTEKIVPVKIARENSCSK